MKKADILLCGYGHIGKKLYPDFLKLGYVDIFDPNIESDFSKYSNIKCNNFDYFKNKHYDIAFICVPTPTVNNKCDTSIVEEMIEKLKFIAQVIVIKSTVPVGFTQNMITKGYNVIFSPEFSGCTPNVGEHPYVLLGGEKQYTSKVAELYKKAYSGNFIIKQNINPSVYEMLKLTANSALATRVLFYNLIADACNESGIDYDDVRECLLLDSRFNPSHTVVYKDQPYYDSHCFNKDVPAFAYQFNNELLKLVENINTQRKNRSK